MMKRKITIARFAAVLCAVVGAAPMAHALDKVHVVIPQNSVFVLNWMGGKMAGIFRKHGIDLSVDARPFAGFLAGLPSKACMVTTYAGMNAIAKMNQGLDWVVIGGGLTVAQDIFVPKNSPIKTVEELRGKRFGVWSTGAGAFKAVRAALIDGYHLDVTKDTKMVQVAAPALFKMAETGRVDAMLNISSFTIAAASMPNKFRSLFSTNEYWKKKTGYPVVWSGPLVAWRSWVEANPDRAKRLAAATEESFRWIRDPKHLDETLKKYGALAGVTKPAEIATYKKWFAEHKIFLAQWNKKAANAEWQFLEMAKSHGIIDKVPSEAKHAMLFSK